MPRTRELLLSMGPLPTPRISPPHSSPGWLNTQGRPRRGAGDHDPPAARVPAVPFEGWIAPPCTAPGDGTAGGRAQRQRVPALAAPGGWRECPAPQSSGRTASPPCPRGAQFASTRFPAPHGVYYLGSSSRVRTPVANPSLVVRSMSTTLPEDPQCSPKTDSMDTVDT